MKKIIVLAITASMLIASVSYGCSIFSLAGQKAEDDVESLPDVEIDEREIELIESIDQELETSYQLKQDISISEEVKDPFKPYYVTEEEEKENMLLVEQIYSEDGIWYAEIKFNEFLYKLTGGDVFANVYKLEVINENSVVLLKGDEIITISLGQLLYD
ncbi:MAG: hypothetical protein ACQEP5_03550 [Actinomycetota bacterium]